MIKRCSFFLIVLFLTVACSKEPFEPHVPELFSTIAAQPQNFIIDSTVPQSLAGDRGTRLNIPADAFQMPDNIQNKQVEILLTEIVDHHEIALAGVPMTWTNGEGEEFLFESAGMFNIEAKIGEQELQLKEGQKITVIYPDIVPGDRFWVYRLNETGRWILDGHNQESAGVSSWWPASANESSIRMRPVFTRIYRIATLGYYNFDQPRSEFAAVKMKFTGGDFSWGTIVGMKTRGTFPVMKHKTSGEYISVFFQNEKVKIIAISDEGDIAFSDPFIMPDRFGHFKCTEGDDCYVLDIGALEFRTVRPAIVKDRSAFMELLGFTSDEFDVIYPNVENIE